MAALASMRPKPSAPAQGSGFEQKTAVHRQLRDVTAPAPEQDASAPAGIERSVYQPNQRSGVAALASLGVMAIVALGLATLNVVAKHEAPKHLTVVALQELETTPPPPPEQPKPTKATPPPVFVPKPMIQLPSPGPTQIALDSPPPPSVELVATSTVNAPVAAEPGPPAPATTSINGGDLSSNVLAADPPTYPIESRRKHEQGTVKLLVLVGTDGKVQDISIASSSGSYRLDRAALHAVKRWRWSPSLRNGVAMMVRGFVTIPFVLTT